MENKIFIVNNQNFQSLIFQSKLRCKCGSEIPF